VIGPSKHGPAQALIVQERKGFSQVEQRVEQLNAGQMQMDPMEQIALLEKIMKIASTTAMTDQRMLAMMQKYGTVDVQPSPTEDRKMLPSPKRIDLIEQIENGLTLPDEELSVFGYIGSQPVQVKLFEEENNFVNSLFVVGIQGQGKSTVGTLLAAYTVNHRGYLLVIDPDAEEVQSITKRLGPLSQFFLCEVANTPEKAERVLSIAETELDTPGDYPVLLLIDEFSMMMRHMVSKDKLAKWKKIAPRIASVVEDYATRGRKRRRRACVFGQIPNATRSGGTELRDQCAYIIFNSPAKKAALILQDARDDKIAESAPGLNPGQAIVSPAKSSDTYIMQFAFPDMEALQIIAETRLELEEVGRGSIGVLDDVLETLEPETDELRTPTELALEADSRRVRTLKAQGKNQEEVIFLLWGARKGGGPKYQNAKARYQECLQYLGSKQEAM
jgi:hypothetical protein